jgi:hypothetical protein
LNTLNPTTKAHQGPFVFILRVHAAYFFCP